MVKLGDNQLSPDLIARLVALLKEMPDAQLLQLGREWLTGGFTKSESIRKRLTEILEGEGTLPIWLQNALADELPGRELIKAISLDYLMKAMNDLESSLGQDTFMLCLMVDEREEVRRLALNRKGRKAAPVSLDENKAAVERLFDSFSSQMAGAFGEILMDPEEMAEELEKDTGLPQEAVESFEEVMLEQSQKIAKLELTLGEEKKHLKDEKKRHKAAVKEWEAKLKVERDQWLAEKETLKRKQVENETQLITLQGALNESEDQRDELIQKGVQEETSFLVRPWLKGTVNLDQEVDETKKKAEDLLERAEQVLQTQAARDRHTGNRFALWQRRKELAEARQKIEDARQQAVHPIPELGQMDSALESEIARISLLLGEPPKQTGQSILDKISANINQSEQASELGPISQLIQLLAENSLLRSSEQRRLYGMVHRKFSLLEDSGKEVRDDVVEDEGWTLRKWIVRDRELQVLVDGHNVLYGLEDLYRNEFEDGHPGAAARQKLIESMAHLVQGRENVDVIVYFDGPTRTTESAARHVRVEYSGGTGKNRADHRIAMDLQFKRMQKKGKKVFVVSDDHEVRQEALNHGARFVPVGEFAVLLGE